MAASLSMVMTSSSPWTTMASRATLGGPYRGPSASLSFCSFGGGGGGTASSSSLTAAPRSPLLHCSPLSSSFYGLSSGMGFGSSILVGNGRRNGLVVMASRFRLCQTKRNRSRKSLARVHGFRKRMTTTSGRAVLKRRRAKGRKVLCPKSNPNSGKRY